MELLATDEDGNAGSDSDSSFVARITGPSKKWNRFDRFLARGIWKRHTQTSQTLAETEFVDFIRRDGARAFLDEMHQSGVDEIGHRQAQNRRTALWTAESLIDQNRVSKCVDSACRSRSPCQRKTCEHTRGQSGRIL